MASKGLSHPFGGFYVCGSDPMTEDRVKRQLSVILGADAEGYSRLMGKDETSALDCLKSHIIRPRMYVEY